MRNERDFQEISLIEKVLWESRGAFEVELPEKMLFEVNEVRKSSEHNSLCLTVADSDANSLYVVKFQNKRTDIATSTLRYEYEVMKELAGFSSIKDSVPKCLGNLEFEGRFIPLYTYEPGKMLYKRLYETQGIFYSELFTKPLDLLFSFNEETSKKTITKGFIDEFKTRLFGNLTGKYSYLTAPINSIWMMYEDKFYDLLIGKPLVYTHNDFNALNMAMGDDYSVKIYDWEDAKSEYPILFDFFYFVLGFTWYLFDDRFSQIKKKDIAENYHKIIELSTDYLNRYITTFSLDSWGVVNALFVMFILNQIIIDTEPKRFSEEFLISRWVHILSKLSGEVFLLSHVQEQGIEYENRCTL